MVQPMKAALYFDSADGFGEWRICISTRADGDLRQMRKKNSALFKIVLKKIKELSNGHFSDDNQKQLTGTETEIPILEAKMTRDSRLVYHIDCVPEFESDVERQVIKIFGVYTHAQLDRRFWDGVGNQLGRKGKEYKRRCTFRNRSRKVANDPNVVLPASFPAPVEVAVTSPSTGLLDLHKDDLEKLHEMLVLEKYVTFSQALLNSIIADQDVAHVFDVSSQEKQIIEHAGSCYVLGRSGTGKTTTMLFKMLGIERSWQACEGALPKPRQVFVTQSRVLAEKVQEFFSKLYESLATAHKSPAELRELAATKQSQQEQGLVDLDEEIEWRGDLPKCYSQLQDDHFPLFITFDQLCRLLEVEFKDSFNELSKHGDPDMYANGAGGIENSEASSNDYMHQRRSAFVSYGVFLESYWPRFPQTLIKGLDPALVFAEFMGVIKGSEQSLGCSTGHLDQDTYCSLSHRTQATFANQRDAIYKLFMAYAKLKRERRDYDAADRTHTLLEALRRQGVPGNQMAFIYVDEAQDNLLIDALVVLRMLCNNPDNGLFWAGDTAQTISIGSSFRFDDLKSFLYRIEVNTVSGPSASDFVPKKQPRSFQLAVNYRSHAGIVKCAHSVIELITKFWPHAIDNLAEERGIIEGLKPVFFTGWDEDSVRYEQFLFGESGSQIEFGAQQCILVRDDAARDRLRAQVGDIGLIMTIYESKGLEFNDVLLYNFFADSTVELSQWRIVFNALPDERKAKYKAPQFDDSRHNGVCRDLKSLYVAITRARKNLWIADSSDKGEPMRTLWTAKDQIQNCTPGSDIPQLATSSTPEEWAKMALTLFNHRRYMQAMHCYDRAGLPREKAVAHAYYLREMARSTSATARGDKTARADAFVQAAHAFWTSAEAAVKERRTYFRISAECYALSGDDAKAAEAYLRAYEYTLSAQHYRKAGLFSRAIDVIKSHREEVDPKTADSIIDVSRVQFLRVRELRQARELFESDEEALEYMDDLGLDVAQADLLKELGRVAEAAKLHLEEGRPLEAIKLFLADMESKSSKQQASRCMLEGLWRGLSFGVTPGSDLAKGNETLQELICMLPALDIADLDEDTRDQVAMFRAIISNNLADLLPLANRFHHQHRNNAATLLCLDHVFRSLPKLQVASLAEIAGRLQDFLLYVRMLQKFASDVQPCDNEDIKQIFGFQSATEESFLLPKETWLYARCNDRLTPTFRNTDEGAVILRWELNKLLRFVLEERLYKKVLGENGENELCRKIRALQLCLPYSALGRCTRDHCPREHINSASHSVVSYNLRVRVIMQQILIYHTIRYLEHPFEQGRQKRYWIRQLHEALEPPFFMMGSLGNLRSHLIPEFEEGLQIVKNWLHDWLYRLVPFGGGVYLSTFLTSLIQTASLVRIFDTEVAFANISRNRCIQEHHPPSLLMSRRGDTHVYIVDDLLAFLADDNWASLVHGILFVNHIIKNRVPIDIGVLCNLLDSLCGFLIVSKRLRGQTALHDITLPLSWLLRILPNIQRLHKRTTKISLYIAPMQELLKQMYTGIDAEYLLYEGRNLSSLPSQMRSVFIARICKNLCLLGYNIPSLSLRADIQHTVTCLSRFSRKFEPIYEQYVTARHWGQLASFVRRQSTSGSELDEMVQLFDATRASITLPPLPNVRRIEYRTIDDIREMLASGASQTPKSNLRADALPFTPSHLLDASEDEFSESQAVDEGADGVEVDPQLQNVDTEDPTVITEVDQPRKAPELPTEKELAAAEKIMSAFRRYVQRRRRADKAPGRMQAIRHRVTTAFQEASASLEWPHACYRMLFLGPIPHLIVCLECAHEHLHVSKKSAKKRFTTAQHQDLEDVNTLLTKTSQSIKETSRLQAALEPKSQLHVRRDLEELKTLALKVEELIHSLTPSVTQEWQSDLKIAIKGIVKAKAPPAKKPKPELNVEDIDDVWGYSD
ncbi:uncharacterized protein LAESUDRAFT_675409 [Laetiporus sulphureus 93-53]|uniref:UvrD-like helicase ATP-binding domain-containing protein n=1 Tax=Laetiporus sulphureus 93-53 TaxID=1314785 RepID=A0A165FG39_9APHY|nr:uncharacterized protein LAESUDRAFT_675409 [Laetiporus sulphureus 93-53]KZT08921.1 hypothetical protein LAESUDRAFT_675409 [Laetiporus sulphureus 93-53]